MKAHFKHMMLLLAFFASTTTLRAQQMPPIPVDKEVRVGRLENGLTYYIRANKRPENRANFYIVQRVGSILRKKKISAVWHISSNTWPLTVPRTSLQALTAKT